MYPPTITVGPTPWTAATRTGVRDPSGYMSSEKMQKLLQIKQAQDRKDRFVKLSEAKRKANQRSAGSPKKENNHLTGGTETEVVGADSCIAAAPTTDGEQTNTSDTVDQPELRCSENEAQISRPRRKTTKELEENFKNIDWAKVDEYTSYRAKQREDEEARQRAQTQIWLRNELERQLEEQKKRREVKKEEKTQRAKELQEDLKQWRLQEEEQQLINNQKKLLQKEALDAQMKQREEYIQEAKREQLRESRQILEQVAREIERAKQIEIREKQIKAAAYQDILEVTARERQLATARLKAEQEEDIRMLKLGVQLEKEALERSRQERLAILNFQQSRANRIAMLVGEDKKEIAMRNALKQAEAAQARKDEAEKLEEERRKQMRLEVQEFLKKQQEEKRERQRREKQECRDLQKQQEKDAEAYKVEQDKVEKERRQRLKQEQVLLIKQMEEHKRRKDLLVSPMEMKLNRILLEEVKEYFDRRPCASPAHAAKVKES